MDIRHNLFSRSPYSVKGPYSGTMDDNLWYNYQTGGYIGPYGAQFTNNVLIAVQPVTNFNGDFGPALDNAHSPNTDAGAITLFCNNLQYNPAPITGTGFISETSSATMHYDQPVGANVHFMGNIIDGFSGAFAWMTGCLGYTIENNLIGAAKFYEISGTWPVPNCPVHISNNTYFLESAPAGATYTLEYEPPAAGGKVTSTSFSDLESFLPEEGSTLQTEPFAFVDPTRDISTYLVAAGLASTSSNPTLIDYLELVRTQAQTTHQWNPALGVAMINAYLRPGHSLANRPFTYQSSCQLPAQ